MERTTDAPPSAWEFDGTDNSMPIALSQGSPDSVGELQSNEATLTDDATGIAHEALPSVTVQQQQRPATVPPVNLARMFCPHNVLNSYLPSIVVHGDDGKNLLDGDVMVRGAHFIESELPSPSNSSSLFDSADSSQHFERWPESSDGLLTPAVSVARIGAKRNGDATAAADGTRRSILNEIWDLSSPSEVSHGDEEEGEKFQGKSSEGSALIERDAALLGKLAEQNESLVHRQSKFVRKLSEVSSTVNDVIWPKVRWLLDERQKLLDRQHFLESQLESADQELADQLAAMTRLSRELHDNRAAVRTLQGENSNLMSLTARGEEEREKERQASATVARSLRTERKVLQMQLEMMSHELGALRSSSAAVEAEQQRKFDTLGVANHELISIVAGSEAIVPSSMIAITLDSDDEHDISDLREEYCDHERLYSEAAVGSGDGDCYGRCSNDLDVIEINDDSSEECMDEGLGRLSLIPLSSSDSIGTVDIVVCPSALSDNLGAEGAANVQSEPCCSPPVEEPTAVGSQHSRDRTKVARRQSLMEELQELKHSAKRLESEFVTANDSCPRHRKKTSPLKSLFCLKNFVSTPSGHRRRRVRHPRRRATAGVRNVRRQFEVSSRAAVDASRRCRRSTCRGELSKQMTVAVEVISLQTLDVEEFCVVDVQEYQDVWPKAAAAKWAGGPPRTSPRSLNVEENQLQRRPHEELGDNSQTACRWVRSLLKLRSSLLSSICSDAAALELQTANCLQLLEG